MNPLHVLVQWFGLGYFWGGTSAGEGNARTKSAFTSIVITTVMKVCLSTYLKM